MRGTHGDRLDIWCVFWLFYIVLWLGVHLHVHHTVDATPYPPLDPDYQIPPSYSSDAPPYQMT